MSECAILSAAPHSDVRIAQAASTLACAETATKERRVLFSNSKFIVHAFQLRHFTPFIRTVSYFATDKPPCLHWDTAENVLDRTTTPPTVAVTAVAAIQPLACSERTRRAGKGARHCACETVLAFLLVFSTLKSSPFSTSRDAEYCSHLVLHTAHCWTVSL